METVNLSKTIMIAKEEFEELIESIQILLKNPNSPKSIEFAQSILEKHNRPLTIADRCDIVP